jgi:hypothetical protein
VQFLRPVGATRDCVAVENVDDAITVQVLFGVANAVFVEVPAGNAADPRYAVCAVGPGCAIVSFATGDRNSE